MKYKIDKYGYPMDGLGGQKLVYAKKKKKKQRKNAPLLCKGYWISKSGKYSRLTYYSNMVKFARACAYAKITGSKWCPK